MLRSDRFSKAAAGPAANKDWLDRQRSKIDRG